ncbi:MAG: monooxygenase [Chloroflexi bacterium]|jgi:2-polyprenyl-6-methoxyphenol hydroxylase-like FAD-dependent oxidoreductase|nr:monooxygenase [Chloroflexota bacterium]
MADRTAVDVAVAGGGPAGILLGLLLARRGVRVVVLEKHADFLRDFRGDTIHPSTLEVMDDLVLTDRLLQIEHHKESQLQLGFGDERVTFADLRRLPSRHRYLALMPQWDLLEFLSTEAARYPGFELRREAEVTGLIEEDGAVSGLRYRGTDGDREVRATLVVAADGRHSRVREAAGLVPKPSAPPMDVLWLRVSSRAPDPDESVIQIGGGARLVLIHHTTYWQLGYVIPKGGHREVRAAGLDDLRSRVSALAPFLAGRMDEIDSWEQVHLLTVEANRLRRWHRAGLLCIGDAAHAMSPVGGVGINLAVQDAVVAANLLAGPLRSGRLTERDLASVQRRRQLPTALTQLVQAQMQRRVFAPVQRRATHSVPWALRALPRVPLVRDLPGRLIGLGIGRARVAG